MLFTFINTNEIKTLDRLYLETKKAHSDVNNKKERKHGFYGYLIP